MSGQPTDAAACQDRPCVGDWEDIGKVDEKLPNRLLAPSARICDGHGSHSALSHFARCLTNKMQ